MKLLAAGILFSSVLCISCAPVTRVERFETGIKPTEQSNPTTFNLRLGQVETDLSYPHSTFLFYYPDPELCKGKWLVVEKGIYKVINSHPMFTARVRVSKPLMPVLGGWQALLGADEICNFHVQFTPKVGRYYTIKVKSKSVGSCSTSIFESEGPEDAGTEIDYVVRDNNTPWSAEGPWCK